MLHYQLLPSASQSSTSLILMHGLFGESGNLMNIAKALHQQLDINVILADMINHGASPHSYHMSYIAMAESVEALIDDLHLEHVILLGHSMGGKVAMQMAARATFDYQGLIIADIAPVDYPPLHLPIIEAMQRIEQAFLVGQIRQRREADAMLAEAVGELSLRQFLLKNLKRQADHRWSWQFGLAEIAESYPELAKAPQFDESLHQCFAAPTLVIKGENSDYVQKASTAAFEQRFSDLQLKVISDAGHWLHAEKPQLFINTVQRYLQSLLL
ncbi:MAG: alpha/beta fold hydrolase [Pseudomonadales bacterium]|nr:alpha/beta fold hydrolase [Pseudomonadales bacterium]